MRDCENAEILNADFFFKHGRGLDDDQAMDGEPDDAIGKMFQAAELSTALGGDETARRFEAQTAGIDERAAEVYRGIAKAAGSQKDSTLAKRASITVEETVYPSGRIVVAELENGVCVRTYEKGA